MPAPGGSRKHRRRGNEETTAIVADFTLVLGNKNYSSWSLRAWLVAKLAGIEFEELVIPLFTPGYKADVLRHSPSGKLPCLKHGDVSVWESLAIAEYLHEARPSALLWPEDPTARAVARSVSAEMHAGFAQLRKHMPMNVRASFGDRGLAAAVQEDVNRITALWRDCRRRFAGYKPFLFGEPCIADAMFAPVASRFVTYGVTLDDDAQDYVNALLQMPAMQEWIEAARREPWISPEYEL
jgi:glutathione S-transferase